MLDPTKKDIPCPGAKEKPQQDGNKDEITFRIKPHTCQRHSEDSNKPCVQILKPSPRPSDSGTLGAGPPPVRPTGALGCC